MPGCELESGASGRSSPSAPLGEKKELEPPAPFFALAAAPSLLLVLGGDDGEGLAGGLGGVLGQLARDLNEELLYVLGVLGGRFEVQDVVLGRVRRCLLQLHRALVLKVALGRAPAGDART